MEERGTICSRVQRISANLGDDTLVFRVQEPDKQQNWKPSSRKTVSLGPGACNSGEHEELHPRAH